MPALTALPDELQLEVFGLIVRRDKCIISSSRRGSKYSITDFNFTFLSKRYLDIASSNSTCGTFHTVLGEYIIEEAPEILVHVQDLNFTNFKAFVNALVKDNKLQDFAYNPESDNPNDRRQLKVSYFFTDKFPNTFAPLLDFAKFTNRLLKKLPGPGGLELCISAEIRECADIEAVARAQNTFPIGRKLGELFDRSFEAVRLYHETISSQQQAQLAREKADWDNVECMVANAPRDIATWEREFRRPYHGVALEANDVEEMQAVAGAEQEEEMQQAVGGAEVSEEDENMESGNLSGGINGEYADMAHGGMQGGWVEEMDEAMDQEMDEQMGDESDLENITEENEEERPVGVLYDHDQYQMAANYQPPVDFSSFLGQAASGFAHAPTYTYQSFWGNY